MPEPDVAYRLVESGGPAGRLVLRQEDADVARLIVCSGFEGRLLPAIVTAPKITALDGGRWLLRCCEGTFEFGARGVQHLEQRPSLYEPMHRPFALSRVDRLAIRLLLALLRMPGGTRLLRHWHSRRS